jgi:hypothetical protein
LLVPLGHDSCADAQALGRIDQDLLVHVVDGQDVGGEPRPPRERRCSSSRRW